MFMAAYAVKTSSRLVSQEDVNVKISSGDYHLLFKKANTSIIISSLMLEEDWLEDNAGDEVHGKHLLSGFGQESSGCYS